MGKAQQASTPSERSHRPARATTCFVMITLWMLPLLRAVIRRRPFNTRLAAKAWQPGTHAKNPGTRAKKPGHACQKTRARVPKNKDAGLVTEAGAMTF